jgi:hypothetical protein
LHGHWGARLRMPVLRGRMWLPRCSSWFLGATVNGAWDSSWRRHHVAWLYLAGKPSHMGADVDELAYLLHGPIVYDRQTRGQSFMSGAAQSHRAVVGGEAFPRGVKSPGLNI